MTHKKIIPIVAAVSVFLIVVIAISSGHTTKAQIAQENISQGIAYIENLEKKDPSSVDQQIKRIRQEQIQAMKDELAQKLTSGQISVWSMFDDYIIMGDSRTIGFSYYGYLPESNVWAKTGATIRDMEAMLPDLYTTAPGYVYLTYGMNDFCSGIWTKPDEFIADYDLLLQQIHENLPDTKIVICSILPATEAAYARANIWSVIPNYNEAIKEMCASHDYCYYIDCDEVAAQYESLYETDGIHFVRDFYPHWATTIIMGVYSIEYFTDDEETPSAA